MLRCSSLALTFAALLLTSCGQDDSGSTSPISTPSPSPTPPSTSELINAAEQRGELPSLDRSSTINGVDANANGVRDDLDVYIAKLAVSPEQQASLAQQAKATLQAMTAATTDRNAMDAARLAEARAINCVYSRLPPTGDKAAGRLSQELEDLTLNTRSRIQAYISYGIASDGTVLPSPEGNTCD